MSCSQRVLNCPFILFFTKKYHQKFEVPKDFFTCSSSGPVKSLHPPQLGKEKSFHPVQSFHPVNISVLACTPLLADLGSNRPSFMAIY